IRVHFGGNEERAGAVVGPVDVTVVGGAVFADAERWMPALRGHSGSLTRLPTRHHVSFRSIASRRSIVENAGHVGVRVDNGTAATGARASELAEYRRIYDLVFRQSIPIEEYTNERHTVAEVNPVRGQRRRVRGGPSQQ